MEDEMDIDLPEQYDWREAYPHCVQPVQSIGYGDAKNCSASYAMVTLGVAEDKICMSQNNTVKLSA